jgi:hypothetical protein
MLQVVFHSVAYPGCLFLILDPKFSQSQMLDPGSNKKRGVFCLKSVFREYDLCGCDLRGSDLGGYDLDEYDLRAVFRIRISMDQH